MTYEATSFAQHSFMVIVSALAITLLHRAWFSLSIAWKLFFCSLQIYRDINHEKRLCGMSYVAMKYFGSQTLW